MRAAAFVVLLAAGAAGTAADFGRAPLTDSRSPPLFRSLDGAAHERVDLGHAIFNTQFTPATETPSRRDGIGPLFNAAACDACHNEGAHGRGPADDGPLPASLVVELSGDPVYGRTFNTNALDGLDPEGQVAVRYVPREVRYPDGTRLGLRAPEYQFTTLAYGPLAADTVVQPRLAPALFGVGLLDALAVADAGRFGWQNTALDVRDQTAQALSRDMGLTSTALNHDDCSAAERACRAARNGGEPEISDEFLGALVAFQSALAVPASPRVFAGDAPATARRFAELGCAGCHVPRQRIEIDGETRDIEPFTDLKRHDLGDGLADHRVNGSLVPSAFRTPPLWGMGYRVGMERFPTFLHDGRARSLEEAVLWHDGEAKPARLAFVRLQVHERKALLRWIASQ